MAEQDRGIQSVSKYVWNERRAGYFFFLHFGQPAETPSPTPPLHTPAAGTREALLMVGVPQGRNYLPFHIEAAGGAALAEVLLVTVGAVVVLLAREEPTLS